MKIEEKHSKKEFIKEFLNWLIDNDYLSIDLSTYGELNENYELFLTLKNSTQEISFDEDSEELNEFYLQHNREQKINEILK